MPRKIGRPRALTPKGADRIVAALRTGAPFRLAAVAGGISARALDRARNPEEPTYDEAFAARCEAAREEGFLRLYERVARSRDWRAARWQLECALPELFARRTIVAGDASNPVRVEIAAAIVASARIRSSRSLLMALVDEVDVGEKQLAISSTESADSG